MRDRDWERIRSRRRLWWLLCCSSVELGPGSSFEASSILLPLLGHFKSHRLRSVNEKGREREGFFHFPLAERKGKERRRPAANLIMGRAPN